MIIVELMKLREDIDFADNIRIIEIKDINIKSKFLKKFKKITKKHTYSSFYDVDGIEYNTYGFMPKDFIEVFNDFSYEPLNNLIDHYIEKYTKFSMYFDVGIPNA